MQSVLIVEYGAGIGELVRSFLTEGSYAVHLVNSVSALMPAIKRHSPAAIFIELGGTGVRGLDICRLIRSKPSLADTPLIIFSATSRDEDRILALEWGADDYLTHPFTKCELFARIGAILRRLSPRPVSGDVYEQIRSLSGDTLEALNSGDIQIDTLAMKVWIKGIEVTTTSLEFRLLHYLCMHRSRVFSRDQLLDAVWGKDQFISPRSVDACIRRIRRKIEPNRNAPTYLKTIRGAGYRLEVAPGLSGSPATSAESIRVNARETILRRAAMGGLAS